MSIRYRHVLVPIDGSERSTIALRTARALSLRLDADLHSVSVVDDAGDLAAIRVAAAGALGVPVADSRVHAVVDGNPAQAIVTVAEALGSCVVCMSTHAHDRLVGTVRGSVARDLLQEWGHPVVMVGPQADRPVYMGDNWVEPLSVERVVVCVDVDQSQPGCSDAGPFNDASQLVKVGADWACALGMSLTLLTVTAPMVTIAGSIDVDGMEDWMARLAAGVAAPDVAVDLHVEIDPISVVDGVCRHLAARPAGLLVVSTHARDGLDRLVHGATAAGITAASPIATLVVPIHQGTGP
jgi:nucleotide-binding universal stress UspA family protein